MTDKAKNYCATLIERGVTYAAEFVPQSQSRNRDEREPSLNWRVTIARDKFPGGPVLVTDYMQGIGHVPGLSLSYGRKTIHQHEQEVRAAETRRGPRGKIPAPEFTDVLWCLVTDADVLEHACFEDWAECYGYDTDSRKAEKIYRQCVENALVLRQIINLDEAREAFEDY